MPEDLGTRIQDIPGRKVIVNKNLFYGFSCLGADVPARYPYAFDDVLGAMTISEHNRRHLAWAFPRLPVQWVATGIDPATFSYRPLREKKAQILCVPKARTHLTVVYHMLQARAAAGLNRARDFTWLVSGDLSEREMARALSESALCLFLSAEEGLGRTPLEAMLAGCLVAGYQYGPVRELPAFIYAAEYAEPLALVHWIETLMAGWPLRVDCWQELVDLRRAEVLRRHRVDDEEDTVVAAWRVLLHARD